jgi:chaperonin GroES
MTTKDQKSKVHSVKPLYDYLLIEPKVAETTTSSGIIIPDTANKEKPQEGTVVSTGAGRMEDGKQVALTVKVGQTVLFKKWGGTEIKLEGKEYLLIKEEDILAIIES